MHKTEHPWLVDAILFVVMVIIVLVALASCKPSPTTRTPQQYSVTLPDADVCPTFSLDAGVPKPCQTFHSGDLRPCAECSGVQACVWAKAMIYCVRGTCTTDPACVVLPADKQ